MDDIGRTQARMLAALWALEGAAWLEVQSEVHETYKEIPFWILLAGDASPIDAHRHFWAVIEPELAHFGGYRVTVSYKAIGEGFVLWHGFFDDPEGMRCALTPAGWKKPIRQNLEAANIFRYVRNAAQPPETKSGKSKRMKRRRQ